MKKSFGGQIIDTSFRIMVPFTLVYGVYILTHGEYSPGGGFQAGALLAAGILMARLVQGANTVFNISGEMAVVWAGLGSFIYALTGYLSIFNGGNQYLDYTFLPFGGDTWADIHATGILLIEIGVTICVMMTIINILDAIIERAGD